MKRILITGGSGFIGHHVVDFLLSHTDWEVVLLERVGYSGNLNRLKELESFRREEGRVGVIWHDLRSPVNAFVKSAIGKVDYIAHLAASTHVDRSIEDPLSFVYDNVIGTANLLEFARTLSDLKLFVNFSTDEVFGPAGEGVYHAETAPHRPSNVYSATKAGARDLALSYFVTYGLPVVTTYTMNNFGERQHPEKLIPKTIRSVQRGEKMPLYASLDKEGRVAKVGSRVWMYAPDTARALSFVLEHGQAGEEYNVIGHDEVDIVTVAESIAKIMGKPLIPEYVGLYGARPGHDIRYALDGAKLAKLGWKPELRFEEALEKVVKFTLENPQWL